jgi:signal transduction histidine kinase/ActR/RegA family two-component response regulator
MVWDLRTLAATSVLLIGVLGVLQLWLWRQDRTLTVLAIWGAAHVLAAAGMVLLVGRHAIPYRLSIDAANALILASYGMVWIGARQFGHRAASIPIAVTGAVLWLALCQVPPFYDSLMARAAWLSATIAVYDLLAAREFFREQGTGPRPLRRALGSVFVIHAVMQVGRAVLTVSIGFEQRNLDLPNVGWFALVMAGSLVLAIVASVLLIAVAKDDAQRHALATLAEAKNTAERANIAKTRFLARMSHELRTPLNGVLGLAQALTRETDLPEEQRQWAALLEQSGRHLLAIVNDMLDLARAEAGTFELAPRAVRVREIVDGTRDLMAETALAKGVELRLVVAPDTPEAVMADVVRVRQIILNLLGNSIKFTPAGGQVTLSVAGRGPAEGIALAVRDTGPGVAPEIVPYLFHDFMLCPVVDATPDGTGMGLSICWSLARAMGGTIRYDPAPEGTGSVFTVDLPLPHAEAPVLPTPKPVSSTMPRAPSLSAPNPSAPNPSVPGSSVPGSSVSGPSVSGPTVSAPGASVPDVSGPVVSGAAASGPVRVLVVDDVATNRRLAEVLLRQAGFEVALAADGAEAVAALREGRVPDVVLMDIYMPGMDGLTATRQIRDLPNGVGRIPIIALTADASPEQIRACEAAGTNGYVAKPFNIEALVVAIRSVLPEARSAEASASADIARLP